MIGETVTKRRFSGAMVRDFLRGRSRSYEDELTETRDDITNEMISQSIRIGTDSVVGAKMNYEISGYRSSMPIIAVSGERSQTSNKHPAQKTYLLLTTRLGKERSSRVQKNPVT